MHFKFHLICSYNSFLWHFAKYLLFSCKIDYLNCSSKIDNNKELTLTAKDFVVSVNGSVLFQFNISNSTVCLEFPAYLKHFFVAM